MPFPKQIRIFVFFFIIFVLFPQLIFSQFYYSMHFPPSRNSRFWELRKTTLPPWCSTDRHHQPSHRPHLDARAQPRLAHKAIMFYMTFLFCIM